MARGFYVERHAMAALHLFRRFMRNRGAGIEGIAAVEFAAVTPMLVLAMICTAAPM